MGAKKRNKSLEALRIHAMRTPHSSGKGLPDNCTQEPHTHQPRAGLVAGAQRALESIDGHVLHEEPHLAKWPESHREKWRLH